AEQMGFTLKWNSKTNRTEIGTPKFKIEVDSNKQLIYINGASIPFKNSAMMLDDRLMVSDTWLNDFFGAKYSYNKAEKRMEIFYVKRPQTLTNDANANSKPVARFTFGKLTYQIGEPVKYVDLSYDPDAEGLTYEWTGKQEAFYKAGRFLVTLRVKDGKGMVSDTYSRIIQIEGGVMFSDDLQRQLYTSPVGSIIKTDWPMLYAHFLDIPILSKKVTEDRSRTMLMSDSPETFTE